MDRGLLQQALQRGHAQRRLALAVIGLVSLTNVVSLGLLVHFLINGGKAGGHSLILSGVVLWATNVLLFAVWYWEMDRGGPVARYLDRDVFPDFQFPQMENPELAAPGWQPHLVDYIYVSFTNALAFSPTDVMPLTRLAKILMAAESSLSAVTVLLVAARAVNILS